MDGNADIWPPQDSNRTAAASGVLGKQFAGWQLRGIRIAGNSLLEQVWQGPTAFPTLPPIAASLTAVSDAGTDTAAGSGARAIAVVYLNDKFEIRLATAKLTGVVPTALFEFDQVSQRQTPDAVVNALRVLSVDVTEVGATGNNDGIVDTSIGADLQARIPRTAPVISIVMKNRARPGGFTVPAGFCVLADSMIYPLVTPELGFQARPPRFGWMGVAGKSLGAAPWADPESFDVGTDLRLVYETIGNPGADVFVTPMVNLYLRPSATSRDSNPVQIPRLSACGFGL